MNLKRVRASEKDHQVLENILTTRKIPECQTPGNFRNCVVKKPWGYESLIFENEQVSVWLLHVNDGHSTSMHCHPLKKTALILLSGRALFNTFQQKSYLTALSGLMIERSAFHSTKSLSSEGIELLEIETPPDKKDLVRFYDAYGREERGYEGSSEIETEDLRRFNYFYFEEPREVGEKTHFTEKYSISIETFFDNDHFQKAFLPDEKEIYTVCRGGVFRLQGEAFLDAGDIGFGGDLKKTDSLAIRDKTVLLKVREKRYENN